MQPEEIPAAVWSATRNHANNTSMLLGMCVQCPGIGSVQNFYAFIFPCFPQFRKWLDLGNYWVGIIEELFSINVSVYKCLNVWPYLVRESCIFCCSAQGQGLLCEEQGNYQDNVKYCGYCSYHYKKLVTVSLSLMLWTATRSKRNSSNFSRNFNHCNL